MEKHISRFKKKTEVIWLTSAGKRANIIDEKLPKDKWSDTDWQV
jgi:hypothetical protein